MRPFDWHRDCPADVAKRPFPAVAGRGRGKEVVVTVPRKMQGRGLTKGTSTT